MNKKLTFIANWKMYWSFDQTTAYVNAHSNQLIKLAVQTEHKIILCPSFPALFPAVQVFKESPIKISAQDCSDHIRGAFTGQVSAEHLKTVGVDYCIIGHSERRQYCSETNEQIVQKCLRLMEQGIAPIICIGETKQEHELGKTYDVLTAQLTPILEILSNNVHSGKAFPFYIAYEPIWSIGTGNIPKQDHLESVFAHLDKLTQTLASTIQTSLLYGGSVSSKNIVDFTGNRYLDGFLIGSASLKFSEFEVIIKKH